MSNRGTIVDHGDALSTIIGGMVVEIRQNTLRVTIINPNDPGDLRVIEHDTRVYGEPFYTTLEGFLRRAGDDARSGIILYEEAGPVLFFYDGGPSKVPTPEECREHNIEFPSEYGSGSGFGYCVNLRYPEYDEPCTAPFPLNSETVAQYQKRIDAQHALWRETLGENAVVINMNPNERVLGVQYDDANR